MYKHLCRTSVVGGGGRRGGLKPSIFRHMPFGVYIYLATFHIHSRVDRAVALGGREMEMLVSRFEMKHSLLCVSVMCICLYILEHVRCKDCFSENGAHIDCDFLKCIGKNLMTSGE